MREKKNTSVMMQENRCYAKREGVEILDAVPTIQNLALSGVCLGRKYSSETIR